MLDFLQITKHTNDSIYIWIQTIVDYHLKSLWNHNKNRTFIVSICLPVYQIHSHCIFLSFYCWNFFFYENIVWHFLSATYQGRKADYFKVIHKTRKRFFFLLSITLIENFKKICFNFIDWYIVGKVVVTFFQLQTN